MVNWSSYHLPFTLRYCVKTNSPPSGFGGRGGRKRERESFFSAVLWKQTCDRAYGKVKCRWTPSISGDREEVCSPHCSFWAWEDPFWLPSEFKCKRLKGRCHVSSYGLDCTPGSNLHAEISCWCVHPNPGWALLGSPLHLSSILEVSGGPTLSCGCERGSWNLQDRGLLVLCEHQPQSNLVLITHFIEINFWVRRLSYHRK